MLRLRAFIASFISRTAQPPPLGRGSGTAAASPGLRCPGTHGASGWEELWREMERCRRYGRQFSIARIPAALTPHQPEARRRDRAREVSRMIRATDHAWFDGSAIYVLLPESGRAAGERMLKRVLSAVPDLGEIEAVRIAAFPTNGLTTGALLAFLDDAGKELGFPSFELEPSHLEFEAELVEGMPASASIGARSD